MASHATLTTILWSRYWNYKSLLLQVGIGDPARLSHSPKVTQPGVEIALSLDETPRSKHYEPLIYCSHLVSNISLPLPTVGQPQGHFLGLFQAIDERERLNWPRTGEIWGPHAGKDSHFHIHQGGGTQQWWRTRNWTLESNKPRCGPQPCHCFLAMWLWAGC